MIPVGREAPDFALIPAVGQAPVRLSDFRGEPVLLLFFPLAFSGVCTDEICLVAEEKADWEALGIQILALSVDSPWVTERFAKETGAAFPILSDFNKDAARAYDVLNDDFFGMRGVADRSAFVVDADGRIRWAWTTDDADVMPPFAEIRAAVRAL